MNRLLRVFGVLFGLLVIYSCSNKNDYEYPPVKMEYLSADIGSDGTVSSILTDDETRYLVVENLSSFNSVADSTIRVVSYYEIETVADSISGVKIYAMSKAVAPLPESRVEFGNGVKTDPVDVVGIWMGRNYLNIILNVKVNNGVHYFNFVEDTVYTVARKKTVSLELYHDARNDSMYYWRRAYLSVPLSQYATSGVDSVMIDFRLYQYNGKEKTYQLKYVPLG